MGRVQQAVERIQEAKSGKIPAPDERIAPQLPVPKGYKLLVVPPEVSDKFESGLAKAEQTMKIEEVGAVCMFVIALGPDAYADKEKFPSGPYCKAGDFVLLRSYSGTRFMVFGKEFRLINDDQVEAVVADPRGIIKV